MGDEDKDLLGDEEVEEVEEELDENGLPIEKVPETDDDEDDEEVM